MTNLPRWLRVVRARCASARRYREFLDEVYQERMRRLSGVELELYEYNKMLFNISVNMAERENEQGRREKDLERREKDLERREKDLERREKDMERRERKALAAITFIKKKKVMRRQRRHHHRLRLRAGSSRLRLRAGTVTTMQLDYDVEKEEGEEEEEADDGDAETADACLWSTAAKRWCALASRDLLGRLVKEGVVQIPHPQSLTTPV